jgi:hypothetical protein
MSTTKTGRSVGLVRNLNKSLLSVLIGLAFIFLAIVSTSDYASGQHHGAPPPLATIRDRKIIMNFTTDPKDLVAGQDAKLDMRLSNEINGDKIQHVTYRITISKDDQSKVSDFFHSHPGELTILTKNTPSSHVAVGGTFDVLTNALVPYPSGKITINGPLFSEAGVYEVDIEITTMDNDITDLQVPLHYQFMVNSTTTN